MMIKDTETMRKLFFWGFLATTVVSFVFGILAAIKQIEDEKPWVKACDDIKAKGELQNMHATTLEEC